MKTRWGMHAATAALALTAAVGVASAAETADDVTIRAGDAPVFEPASVQIEVGDTVTWEFDNPGLAHNVVSASDNWDWTSGQWSTDHGSHPYTFAAAGLYAFKCELHPDMKGTVRVGPDPSPTGTATATATATGSPTPESTPHVPASPPPQPGGAIDTAAPSVRRLRSTAVRRGANLRFTLSERATVTLKVRRRSRLVRTLRVQAGAGARTVRLRGLRRGRYRVELRARDAMGNVSAATRVTVRAR